MSTSTDKQEREIKQLTPDALWLLANILGLKTECHYCGKEIRMPSEIGALYNHPDRLVCKSIICLSDLMEDE